MKKYFFLSLIFLFFAGTLLSGTEMSLVYDWGGSYRRTLALPEHHEIRQQVLASGEALIDDHIPLPDWDTEVTVFSFEPEDVSNEIWYCFTFNANWNLENPGRGGWIVKRDRMSSEILGITIYLSEDGSNFAEINAGDSGENSMLSIHLGERAVQRFIPLKLTLDEAARAPFRELADLSSGYVDWSIYLPDPSSIPSGSVRELASLIRPLLPRLNYVEDGAMDSDGRYVLIGDGSVQGDSPGLNCSGFVKWVVDGLVFPLTGELLPLEEMKQRRLTERGNSWSRQFEEVYDPYFGLDWTRNLALGHRRILFEEAGLEQIDVDDLIYHPYRENIGFPLSWLHSIAYELAVRESRFIYLLSVNDQQGSPPLRRHFHTAVLFPYLDERGILHAVIYENGNETPVEKFIMRYPGAYVHLVRVAADTRFDPPAIRLEPVLRRQ
jgi:hypothetical protein